MLDNINSYLNKDANKKYKLNIAINPNGIYESQFVLKTHIFLFEEASGSLSIDFIKQPIEPGSLYIVPPLHFYHLSNKNTGNFICIVIDNELLNPYHKQWLYAIKYNKIKMLSITDGKTDHCNFHNLSKLAEDYNYNEFLVVTIGNWLKDRIPAKIKERLYTSNLAHIDHADRLLGLLGQKELTLDNYKVNILASEMFCTERNLHRICTKAFGLCARNVSNYHFTLKALYLLSNYQLNFSDIADELCFSSITSFNHFIKKHAGSSPSEIRKNFMKSEIYTIMNNFKVANA